MKLNDLVFVAEANTSDMVLSKMLLKLYAAKQPMKILLRNVKVEVKHPDGNKVWTTLPEKLWDVTHISVDGNNDLLIHTQAPVYWLALNPTDEDKLTVKKDPEGYWLISQRDGKGVRM